MRRMCGWSSQIRNRSMLNSMRYMVRPGQAKQYTGVNHIAALVKEWLRSRPIGLARIPVASLFSGQEPSFKAGLWPSGPELLAQDAFLEAVTGIEQHPHRDRLVGQHLDALDVAHVVMVGGGRNRALFALEHLDDNESGVREQGAAPAARAEGADRGQRQKRGVDRQDRSLG